MKNFSVLIFQIIKFSAVGIINTAVDFAVLNILLSFKSFRKRPIVANTISVSVAIVNSYLWNKYWTFAGGQAKYVASAQFSIFVFASLIGLLINSGVMYLILRYIFPKKKNDRIFINIAKLVAIAISMIWNFLAYKLLVF